jgi:hypothetical protein
MKSILAAATILSALAFATAANATIISATYDFSANLLVSLAGFADPLTGSFTLSFDNSADIPDSTVGLTVNSLNHPHAAAITVEFTYSASADLLTFGGSQTGVDGATTNTDDFILEASNVSSAPAYVRGFETVAGSIAGVSAPTGSLTVIPVPVPVPEPASLALLGVGVLGLGALRHRRKAA